MITGCLQQKNNTYYAVLYIKVDGKRKTKWVPTGLPVAGTSDRKAKKAFDQIRLDYEQEQEEKADELDFSERNWWQTLEFQSESSGRRITAGWCFSHEDQ